MDSDPKNNRPKKELIRLWQVSSGKVFRTFEIPDDHLGALTFAPGGKALAAVWHDGSVRVWDVGSGKEVRRFPSPHPGDAEIRPVRATPRVTFSPDGRLVVTREPPLVEEAEPLLVPDGEPLLAPDGGTLWYKLAERTTIRFRELASGKERRHFLFAGEAGRLPWGIAIAGPGGHGFVIFEEFGIWGNASQVITFSPDGKALALAGDQTIHLHHPVTGKELRRFGGFGIIAGTAAFSPDGKLLAAGTYDGAIFFWEVATGSILGRFRGHRNAVTALAFAADGKTLVSGGADTTALVWDVAALLQAARARPPSLETIRKRQAPPKRCSRRNQSKPQASWSSPR
jgi:WD40 repeat protein